MQTTSLQDAITQRDPFTTSIAIGEFAIVKLNNGAIWIGTDAAGGGEFPKEKVVAALAELYAANF